MIISWSLSFILSSFKGHGKSKDLPWIPSPVQVQSSTVVWWQGLYCLCWIWFCAVLCIYYRWKLVPALLGPWNEIPWSCLCFQNGQEIPKQFKNQSINQSINIDKFESWRWSKKSNESTTLPCLFLPLFTSLYLFVPLLIAFHLFHLPYDALKQRDGELRGREWCPRRLLWSTKATGFNIIHQTHHQVNLLDLPLLLISPVSLLSLHTFLLSTSSPVFWLLVIALCIIFLSNRWRVCLFVCSFVHHLICQANHNGIKLLYF